MSLTLDRPYNESTSYRGVRYDLSERRFNQLALIKKQLEKIEAQHQASLLRAKQRS